jgi:LacI family transcriptional regulator
MAFAVLHVADRERIAIPGRLSVMSFEDTPGVRFSVPPMSAIRQPTAKMIATACERLISLSRGEKGLGRYRIAFSLVDRETTGPAPE